MFHKNAQVAGKILRKAPLKDAPTTGSTQLLIWVTKSLTPRDWLRRNVTIPAWRYVDNDTGIVGSRGIVVLNRHYLMMIYLAPRVFSWGEVFCPIFLIVWLDVPWDFSRLHYMKLVRRELKKKAAVSALAGTWTTWNVLIIVYVITFVNEILPVKSGGSCNFECDLTLWWLYVIGWTEVFRQTQVMVNLRVL